MKHYVSLQLKGLQNYNRSNFKVQNNIRKPGIHSNFKFDLFQFCIPLRCKDALYLIWKSWLMPIAACLQKISFTISKHHYFYDTYFTKIR